MAARERFEVLITAAEAWPAFERAVLQARRDIVAGFRIFDMTTRLRSEEARSIGETWFDLLAHVASRGVRIDLVVSDFDPVMATDLHEIAWTTVRQGAALAEVADCPADQIRVRAALHPARAGALPWLAFLPASLRKRNEAIRETPEDRLNRQAVGLDRGSLPQLHTVSHHQKLAVIDSEVLYVGGLDLNERRWDTPDHELPADQSWSDVQVIMTGPEAVDARTHLLEFEAVCAGKSAPTPAPHLRRTLSAPRRFQLPFLSPRTVLSEIEEAHLRAFGEARQLIYLETQFMRSSRISDALAERGVRSRDLTALVILPGLPEDVAYDGNGGVDASYGLALTEEATGTLVEAFGERITLATPVRPVLAARESRATLAGSPMIHVHNKVLVRDDAEVLIGSANLNGRSMRWDTEVAVTTSDPARVAHARSKLLGHWWFDPLPEMALDPAVLQPWWHSRITQHRFCRPESRGGFLVPFDRTKGSDLSQPLPLVTEEIV